MSRASSFLRCAAGLAVWEECEEALQKALACKGTCDAAAAKVKQEDKMCHTACGAGPCILVGKQCMERIWCICFINRGVGDYDNSKT